MYTSLDKVNNSRNSRVEESKLKVQKLKASSLNNFLYFDQEKNIETSDKSWKEKKK